MYETFFMVPRDVWKMRYNDTALEDRANSVSKTCFDVYVYLAGMAIYNGGDLEGGVYPFSLRRNDGSSATYLLAPGTCISSEGRIAKKIDASKPAVHNAIIKLEELKLIKDYPCKEKQDGTVFLLLPIMEKYNVSDEMLETTLSFTTGKARTAANRKHPRKHPSEHPSKHPTPFASTRNDSQKQGFHEGGVNTPVNTPMNTPVNTNRENGKGEERKERMDCVSGETPRTAQGMPSEMDGYDLLARDCVPSSDEVIPDNKNLPSSAREIMDYFEQERDEAFLYVLKGNGGRFTTKQVYDAVKKQFEKKEWLSKGKHPMPWWVWADWILDMILDANECGFDLKNERQTFGA